MSKVRIYGDVSGYVDIAVPDNAGTTTLNLDKIPQADTNGNIAMDTNTLYVDAANNRVGVGTASPNTTLDVVSPSGAEAINIRGRSADDIGQLKFYENDGTTGLARLDSRTTHFEVGSYNELRFSAGGVGNSHIVIDISGNVGIGVSDPDSKLEIVSHANQEPLTIQATTNSYNYITHRNSAGTDVAYTGLGGGAAVTTGAVTDYAIRATTNLLFGAGSNSERMRIDSSGNLLLGKTSANGTSGSSANDGFEVRPTFMSMQSNTVAAYFNTRTNGDIATFQKDGTAVGSIGVSGTRLTVGSGGGASGIRFDAAQLIPTISNVASNNGVDIGWTDARIRNFYISGGVQWTEGQVEINSGRLLQRSTGDASGLRFDGSGYTPFKNGSTADGTVDLGYSGGRYKNLYLSGGVYLGGVVGANKLDDYEEGTWTPTTDGTNPTVVKANYTKIGNTVHLFVYLHTLGNSTGDKIHGLPFAPSGNMYASARYHSNSSNYWRYVLRTNANDTSLRFLNSADGGVAITTATNSFLVFSLTYETNA